MYCTDNDVEITKPQMDNMAKQMLNYNPKFGESGVGTQGRMNIKKSGC